MIEIVRLPCAVRSAAESPPGRVRSGYAGPCCDAVHRTASVGTVVSDRPLGRRGPVQHDQQFRSNLIRICNNAVLFYMYSRTHRIMFCATHQCPQFGDETILIATRSRVYLMF